MNALPYDHDLIIAVILGIVQAFTEFLPVSSSGHLALSQQLLGGSLGEGASFEVAVHIGTLLSVLVVFRRDLLELLSVLLRPRTARPERRADLMFIILGCVPAGLIGVTFKDQLESAFGSVFGVGVALCFTGLALLSTLKLSGTRRVMTKRDALLVGLAQALAILPGISRSGSTISAALWLGVERERAARLSFLMSMPVVAGAGLLKALDLARAPLSDAAYQELLVGGGTAFIFGIGALVLMLKWVSRPSFGYFGLYCLGAGGVAIWCSVS